MTLTPDLPPRRRCATLPLLGTLVWFSPALFFIDVFQRRFSRFMKDNPQPVDTRQRIRVCCAKDFDVSYFCGSGAGGQARNKVHSGVQIIHRESGAIGRASDTRSQAKNKHEALVRLTKTPQFKFWLAKKLYEIDSGEKLEKTIEREMRPENLRFEIKNAKCQWEEVNEDYFNGPAALEEV